MAALRAGKTNNEADQPSSPVLRFGADKPLKLDAGTLLSPFQIAYQTYGTLNDARSNAILVCHEVGRQAVMADPDWHGGKYFENGKRPEKGLAVARMT